MTALSQDSLIIKSRIGLALSIKEGFEFENVGLKYWPLDDLALMATVGFGFAKRTPETANYGFIGKYESDNAVLGIGIQYVAISVEAAQCYLTIGGKYRTSSFDETIPISGGGTVDWHYSLSETEIALGAGIEYWVAKRFTISGQHVFIAAFRTHNQKSTNSPEQKASDRDFTLGRSSLIFSFYL